MERFPDLALGSPQDISGALERAFDRAADFMAVQRADGGITVESVTLLQEAVGIAAPARGLFRERLSEVSPASMPGQVLFGVILGLLAAEFDAEDSEHREELQ